MDISTGVIHHNLSSWGREYPNVTKDQEFKSSLSSAIEKVEKQQHGDIIGFSTIMNQNNSVGWIIQAKYAADSTVENPIIYVETNYGGEKQAYNIRINDIDPENASRLEIFALSSYADDQGIGSGSTFGTYSTLKNFLEMAVHNGYLQIEDSPDKIWEQFKNEKLNWEKSSINVMELLYRCNDMLQYNRGANIMKLFSKYPTNSNA